LYTGKTAITLGLLDAAEEVNGHAPNMPRSYENGFIATKATLVVVAKHLMRQWPQEINKFLGTKRRVIVLKDMSSLNNLTIEEVQRANIVVVSFDVLLNEKYFTRLARFQVYILLISCPETMVVDILMLFTRNA
jgi:superfamily II DNA or RNA helicase